jgi:H+/Cl- antiporter ClcA
MKKTIARIVLGLLAALLGGLVGGVAAEFLHFIEWSQHLLWHEWTHDLPVQVLILTTLGGLIIGLLQRYLGDHPKDVEAAIEEISETGRLDYTHLPQGMLTASTSLIFGASLGPEAAIMSLMGGLGTLNGDIMQAFRTRFKLPEQQKSENRIRNWIRRWPTIIAFLAGGVVFVRRLDGLYSGGIFDLSAYPFQWADLLWTIPLALIGALGGWLYLKLQQWMQQWFAPLREKPVLLGILGGFGLGLTAIFLPLVLFSGQHQFNPMFQDAVQLGFWVLLLTGIARLILTSMMLNTGWKGGQFLPIMFAAAALGLSVSVVFPVVSPSSAALGAIGALLTVVLPTPRSALILLVLLFPLEYVGIMILSVGTVALIKMFAGRLEKFATQNAEFAAAED